MEMIPEPPEPPRRTALIIPIAWGALAILLVLLLCGAWQGPDVFSHMALGKGILATGQPQPPDPVMAQQPGYLNIYWLFQIVLYGLYAAGGVIGVTLFMMAVWIGVFILWRRVSRAALIPVLGLPIALIVLLVLQGRFDPRPDAVSWLLLMIELYFLTKWDFTRKLSWRQLALFALVQVVWTNTHVFFILGPAVVAAFFLSLFLHGGSKRPMTEAAKLLGVTLLASLASPFGFNGWRQIAVLWGFAGQMRESIIEFRPPTGVFFQLWTVKLLWVFWGATALALIFLLIRRRLRIFHGLLAVPALYLSATSVRYMPALPLLSAPLWGLLIESLATRKAIPAEAAGGPVEPAAPDASPSDPNAPVAIEPAAAQTVAVLRRPGRIALGVAAGTGVLSLAFAVLVLTGGFYTSLQSPTRFGPSLPDDAYPLRVAQYLRQVSFEGKVFNNSADGAYLEFAFPQIRPYTDPRYMDVAIAKEYFAALHDPKLFHELDRKWRFDGVLLRVAEDPDLLSDLLASEQWMLVYADLHRAFFVRVVDVKARGWTNVPFRFYQGEDLASVTNWTPSIQWVVSLVRLKNRPLVLDALRQFDRAPRIPSWIIQYALGYGLQMKDREIVALGRGMHARMVARRDADRESVERLMTMTAQL